jgi:hypothetical protein
MDYIIAIIEIVVASLITWLITWYFYRKGKFSKYIIVIISELSGTVRKCVPNVPRIPLIKNVYVPLTLIWDPVVNATGYELILSEDPSFTIIEWAVNVGAETFYAVENILKYNTTYYWRVRAISDTQKGPWMTGVFTTDGEVGE